LNLVGWRILGICISLSIYSCMNFAVSAENVSPNLQCQTATNSLGWFGSGPIIGISSGVHGLKAISTLIILCFLRIGK